MKIPLKSINLPLYLKKYNKGAIMCNFMTAPFNKLILQKKATF